MEVERWMAGDFLQIGGRYAIIRSGSVAEWLKAHDSKSCGQKCLGGSNPLASARKRIIKICPFRDIFLLCSPLENEDSRTSGVDSEKKASFLFARLLR